MQRKMSGYVYVIRLGDYHKIGCTSALETRLAGFMTMFPVVPEVVLTVFCEQMYETERMLHSIFQDQRSNGEWFELSDSDVFAIRSMFED